MTRAELCAKKHEALAAFGSIGEVEYCEPYGNGHINDTFLTVSTSKKRYILQRINHQIFTRPDEIMENAFRVAQEDANIYFLDGEPLKITPYSKGSDECEGSFVFI